MSYDVVCGVWEWFVGINDEAQVGVGVGIISAFGVYFVIRTWLEMKSSSQKELRAYVFIKGISTIREPDENSRLITVFDIEIDNYGKTPAYQVFNFGKAVICEKGKEPVIDIPKRSKMDSWGVIPPGGGMDTKIPFISTDLEAEQIRSHKMGICVAGRILYLDEFGGKRFTDFKLIYDGRDGYEAIKGGSGRGRACQTGNDAGEEKNAPTEM